MVKVPTKIVVADERIADARDFVKKKMEMRIAKKGQFSHASRHESLGLIAEEYWELIEAIKGNDDEEILHELADVAVGCIWAIASMMEKEEFAKHTQEQLDHGIII